MKYRSGMVCLFCLVAILLAFPRPALADIAPPLNPPGSNIGPGSEITQVRMIAEKVVVEVLDDGQVEGLGTAHVTAAFTMHNLGSQVETMQVRFPVSADDGWGSYPQITNVSVNVEGRNTPTSMAADVPPDTGALSIPWVEFEVTFPPGEDILISVAYDLKGSGYYPYTAFYYLLETGAGWKDTIGKAEIILRLPYEASPLNVVQEFQIGWAETNWKGVFAGSEVRWLYEDFEPGPFSVVQNMEFAIVAPGAWKKVLIAQGSVKASPNDGEAWGRLAKAYKDLFLLSKGYRQDAGGEELYRLSVEAYETCLRLKPGDAQWHAGFADLLANRAYWDSWTSGPTGGAIRALQEIHTALQIAPKDAKVMEIAENIYWLFPEGMVKTSGGYDFPWLAQTPTPRPSAVTSTPAFDPVRVSGVYTSPWLTLWDGQQAKLELTMTADYTAVLATTFQGQEFEQLTEGAWTDEGDGLIRLMMAWPNGHPYTFVFRVAEGQLVATEYSSYFGEAGVTLEKPVEAAKAPTETVEPSTTLLLKPTGLAELTWTVTAQPVSAVTPLPVQEEADQGNRPVLPCASVSLGLLAAGGAAWRKKRIH